MTLEELKAKIEDIDKAKDKEIEKIFNQFKATLPFCEGMIIICDGKFAGRVQSIQVRTYWDPAILVSLSGHQELLEIKGPDFDKIKILTEVD